MASTLRYTGVRKDGTSAGGAVDAHANTAAGIAQQLFDKGWLRAQITKDGELVGAVGRINGKRDWWGECV